MSALDAFHPLVAGWFTSQVGKPTEVQERAWPAIAAGGHVLLTAPTGSGKTFAAFLWSLDRILTGAWPCGATSVLYVSPLKALNNDIQRNLSGPLGDLRRYFAAHGEALPPIEALTRSGDTPQPVRRRMLRHPPEILITTPESLNLMLTSAAGRAALSSVRTVILDEIHAVVDGKRGVHLATAVERLVPLAGEFQRVALSATVNPLETIAAFVAGRRLIGPDAFTERPIHCIRSHAPRRVQVRLVRASSPAADQTLSETVAPVVAPLVEQNRSTLVFVNSRRLSESLAARLNEGREEPVAYAHHGSLSREVRLGVERRLKRGDLKCIVATSSLEMGIDIGTLDEVILVQSPSSVASAIQRVGRSGHEVGQTSRGTLVATHARDLIELSVLGRSIGTGDIEPTHPVEGALDVLAQVVVSMAAAGEIAPDEIYDLVRCSYPYRRLPRHHFDAVLAMLSGRYDRARIRELRPRVAVDELTGTVALRQGALQALYADGGTIPDRGYFQMRLADSRQKLGELDEEFVWENGPGSRFTFGNRNWRVERVTRNDVLVSPHPGGAIPPFWKAEAPNRSWHFSRLVGEFLEESDQRLTGDGLAGWLADTCGLDAEGAEHLADHLARQRAATSSSLPHRHHVLVERIDTGPQGVPGSQVFVHLIWGRRVIRPLALALQAAWKHHCGFVPEMHAFNDGISIVLPDGDDRVAPLDLLDRGEVLELLRESLESSSFFGGRFRECAARALLISRGSVGRRMPLWMSRLRAQELLDAVAGFDDFPIITEAWRSCCQDEFDLEALDRLLGEVADGTIEVSDVSVDVASPFAESDVWRQVNEYMYADEPTSAGPSRLRSSLIAEVVRSNALRPAVSADLAAEYQTRLQRTAPGYQPRSALELVEWVDERLAVPWCEWQELQRAVAEDEIDWSFASPRLLRLLPEPESEPLVATRGALERLTETACWWKRVGVAPLEEDDFVTRETDGEPTPEAAAQLLGEWLRFYGPLSVRFAEAALSLSPALLDEALGYLIEAESVVRGPLLREDDGEWLCDTRNFESLLRIARLRSELPHDPLPAARLPLILARRQGLVNPARGTAGVLRAVERLSGLVLPAEQWEADVLPARVPDYAPTLLDQAAAVEGAVWIAAGEGRVALLFDGEQPLAAPPPSADGQDDPLPPGPGRCSCRDLQGSSRSAGPALYAALWSAAWRGAIANDGFVALRAGLESGFHLPPVGGERRRRGPRSQLRHLAGNWYRVNRGAPPSDEVEQLELDKERVRLLLGRYGILFRGVLQREPAAFRWSELFRSLRLMELAGEVVSGEFIAGVGWPQFTTPRYLREATSEPPAAVFWLNAADPASPCGLGLPFDPPLPRRHTATHLAFRGTELAMVSERHGKVLSVHLPPTHPDLPACLAPLLHLLSRPQRPLRRLLLETINGEPACRSPYREVLEGTFDVRVDHHEVILHRRAAAL